MTAWEKGYWSVLTRRTFTLRRAVNVNLGLATLCAFLVVLSAIASVVDERFRMAGLIFLFGGVAFFALAYIGRRSIPRSRR